MAHALSAPMQCFPRRNESEELAADHPVRSAYALVLAGGRGARLKQMTDGCAKPAVPFAGSLKIIDFTLSNCVNSGIRQISVLTQYKAQSLNRHIGQDWAFLGADRGEFIDVVPSGQSAGLGGYSGTADAVYQNLSRVRRANPRLVLILAGDHVYKMDYRRIIEDHLKRSADLTVACIEVPLAQASAFGVMGIDERARIRVFDEKPACPKAIAGRPGMALASMGIYVFDADFLYRELQRDAMDADSSHDFGHDIIPRVISSGSVFAHDFASSCVGRPNAEPYWRDVGTLDAYWQANMDLARPDPDFNLYDDSWPIRGKLQDMPPKAVVFNDEGNCGLEGDSLVSSGCVVSGATVRRSMLFSKAQVGNGSVIEDSLLLPNVVLGRNCTLRRTIIDSHCVLPDGMQIGLNREQDRSRFTVSGNGVTLVTPVMLAQCDKDTASTLAHA